MSISAIAAGAALLLVLPAEAHAQNKCVDAKGKVTYQQDPCPGQVRTPAAAPRAATPSVSAPPTPQRPAPAAAPSAPPPVGRSSMDLRRESADMEMCAGTWDIIAERLERGRKEVARLRAQGRDTAREEMLNLRDRQDMMARFLSTCGKYGFQDVRDPQAEQRNSAIAKDLTNKLDAKGAEIEAAAEREQSQRDAPRRERERAAQADSDRRQCETAARQVAEAKATRSQIPAQQLAEFDRSIAKAEREVAQSCPPR